MGASIQIVKICMIYFIKNLSVSYGQKIFKIFGVKDPALLLIKIKTVCKIDNILIDLHLRKI